MQIEVRSLNVTWRRDFEVIRSSFFGNVSNCWLNSYGKSGGATHHRFFDIYGKPEGGGGRITAPPPAVRGLKEGCHLFDTKRFS